MSETLRIGVIGDYNPSLRSHQATVNAIGHAADGLRRDVDIRRVPTPSLVDDGQRDRLHQFAGIWAAPGSPYRSREGAHRGMRFARQNRRAFLAT